MLFTYSVKQPLTKDSRMQTQLFKKAKDILKTKARLKTKLSL